MSVSRKLVSLKLQVRVEDLSSGKAEIKNVNVSRIKLTATDAQLLEAGNALADLQSLGLSGVRTINTGDLLED